MDPWKTLSRRTLYHDGPYLTVEHHSIALPGGRVVHDWPWVVTPEYVNIAVVTEEGRFVCFRQTKYAIEGVSLAPPGGYVDAGETPLQAARRELREETGYEAGEWRALGSYPVDGNRGSGVAHLFLARDARRVASPCSDDWEEQELVLLSRAEIESALRRGELRVLGWAATMALALCHLASEQT